MGLGCGDAVAVAEVGVDRVASTNEAMIELLLKFYLF